MGIPISKRCDIIGCENLVAAKGLCEKHYKRLKRHGSPDDKFGKATIDGKNIQDHPLYGTWRNITRTNGGKDVCERWKDFIKFVEDVVERPSKDHHFMRTDTEKQFELSNVFWRETTKSEDYRKGRAAYMLAYNKKKRDTNPDYFLSKDLKKYYGIDLTQYLQMSKDQGDVCAICGQPETAQDYKYKKVRRLAVDHCHTTSKVRGLLCHMCNAMLGSARDSVETLKTAISYLHKHSEAPPSQTQNP